MGKRIILHWLNLSRSHRILWLLEELNIEYEIKIYHRNSGYRAPPELFKVHPLGKSPVIEVLDSEENDGKPLIIAETGRIIEYLLYTFDHSERLQPVTKESRGLVSYYLHYTEGTLQPFLTSLLVLELAKGIAPFLVRPLVKAVVSQIIQAYYGPEFLLNLEYLENIAKENDGGYFVDGKLTGADIILSFPIAESIFDNDRASVLLNGQDPKEKYPYLAKWAKSKVLDSPTHKKCSEIIAEKEANSARL